MTEAGPQVSFQRVPVQQVGTALTGPEGRITPLGLAMVCSGVVMAGLLQPALSQPLPSAESQPKTTESTLLYVSDYFSFIGKDDQGYVAFALDNNRGRDGDAFQAEHFVVLHDERRGWIEVVGGGAYENGTEELRAIPDSAYFQFQGSASEGVTIVSPKNDLTLRIEPIASRHSRDAGGGSSWMGSAEGVLEWAGRTLKGRVIYEYLLIPEFNRLTRTYFGLWNEFQGFYLTIEDEGRGDGGGDVYVRSHLSERLAPVVEPVAGYVVLRGEAENLREVKIESLNRAQALGLYQWPTKWRVSSEGREGAVSLHLELSQRRVMANWVIGGFAMGILRGELRYKGRRQPVYGLAELLM